jgi:hypothetical protein
MRLGPGADAARSWGRCGEVLGQMCGSEGVQRASVIVYSPSCTVSAAATPGTAGRLTLTCASGRQPVRAREHARTCTCACVCLNERVFCACTRARAKWRRQVHVCARLRAAAGGTAELRRRGFGGCGPPQTCCALRAHASPGKARSRGHGAGATGRATAGQDPSPAAAICRTASHAACLTLRVAR